MESEDNAPPLLDITLELGLTRMQQLVGDSEDEIYRPRICLVVDSKSAMIIAMEMGKLGEDELAVAGRALNETFARIKGVPRQIITRKPDVAAMLKEYLQKFGVEVLVRESLPAAEQALHALHSSGPLSGPAEPSMIKTPGMTLDHVIDFAEAGDLFYKAAPWQHLIDDDVIQIHSPAGPKGTAFAQVLGAAGQVMGLGFVSSLEEHENLQAGGGLPDKPVWNLLYGTLDELPYDDGELWETHSLPAADTDAYPLFKRFTPKLKVSLPKPKELAWAEGLLRALAATTEDELDSGRWEKSVKTSEGPAVYSFSLPILLEQMQERKSTGSPSSPQAMLEQFMQKAADHARGIETRSTAKSAQELCWDAMDARGRRQVQLARQALKIDPDCCDAQLILANRCIDDEARILMLRNAVASAERQLGPKAFQEFAGHFWGFNETRPYMRARKELADALFDIGQLDESIQHFQQLLQLNPNDNQGNRYLLAQVLLTANRLDELDQLLNHSSYSTEDSAELAFARALLEFRRTGNSPQANKMLDEAIKTNSMVLPFLAGMIPLPPNVPDHSSPGGLEEAILVAGMSMDNWLESEGAIDWLKEQSDKPAAKRTTKSKKSGKKKKG